MTDRAEKLRAELEAIEGPDAIAAQREQERISEYLSGVGSNLAVFERQLGAAKSDPKLEAGARAREVERLKAEVAAAKAEIKRVSDQSSARA